METITISQTASILDVIKRIEKNKNRAVFVVNDAGGIVGVLTDGDVRRYIIKQGKDFNVYAPIETLIKK